MSYFNIPTTLFQLKNNENYWVRNPVIKFNEKIYERKSFSNKRKESFQKDCERKDIYTKINETFSLVNSTYSQNNENDKLRRDLKYKYISGKLVNNPLVDRSIFVTKVSTGNIDDFINKPSIIQNHIEEKRLPLIISPHNMIPKNIQNPHSISHKKDQKSIFSRITKRCNIETKLSDPNTKYMIRISFNIRKKAIKFPLLIISAEGVIGNMNKSDFWSKNKDQIIVRKKFFQGIIKLMNNFQVILFYKTKSPFNDYLTNNLIKNGIIVDGIYKRKESKDPYLQDYSAILSDFSINENDIPTKVAILTTSNLSEEELTSSYTNADIINRTFSLNRYCVPLPSKLGITPLTIVIPNINSNSLISSISFLGIQKIISSVLTKNSQIITPKQFGEKSKMLFRKKAFENSQKLMSEIFMIKTNEVYKKIENEYIMQKQLIRNQKELRMKLKKIPTDKQTIIKHLSSYCTTPEIDFMIMISQELFNNSISEMKRKNKKNKSQISAPSEFSNTFCFIIPHSNNKLKSETIKLIFGKK